MNHHLTRKYIWRLHTVYLCIDSFFLNKRASRLLRKRTQHLLNLTSNVVEAILKQSQKVFKRMFSSSQIISGRRFVFEKPRRFYSNRGKAGLSISTFHPFSCFHETTQFFKKKKMSRLSPFARMDSNNFRFKVKKSHGTNQFVINSQIFIHRCPHTRQFLDKPLFWQGTRQSNLRLRKLCQTATVAAATLVSGAFIPLPFSSVGPGNFRPGKCSFANARMSIRGQREDLDHRFGWYFTRNWYSVCDVFDLNIACSWSTKIFPRFYPVRCSMTKYS